MGIKFIGINIFMALFLLSGCSKAVKQDKKAHRDERPIRKWSDKSYKKKRRRKPRQTTHNPMTSRIITMGGKPGEDDRYQGISTFDAKYEKVFEAVMEMIKYKEYKLKKKDRQGGIIESDYRLHDGLFTLGFIGSKLRSKMLAELKELETNKTQVTLWLKAEKDNGLGEWVQYPVADYNLDLIDSDSYEMLFFFVTSYIKNGKITKVAY